MCEGVILTNAAELVTTGIDEERRTELNGINEELRDGVALEDADLVGRLDCTAVLTAMLVDTLVEDITEADEDITEADGDESEADEDITEADGDESEADGDESEADGDKSEADGDENEADGDKSEADGDESEADELVVT